MCSRALGKRFRWKAEGKYPKKECTACSCARAPAYESFFRVCFSALKCGQDVKTSLSVPGSQSPFIVTVNDLHMGQPVLITVTYQFTVMWGWIISHKYTPWLRSGPFWLSFLCYKIINCSFSLVISSQHMRNQINVREMGKMWVWISLWHKAFNGECWTKPLMVKSDPFEGCMSGKVVLFSVGVSLAWITSCGINSTRHSKSSFFLVKRSMINVLLSGYEFCLELLPVIHDFGAI